MNNRSYTYTDQRNFKWTLAVSYSTFLAIFFLIFQPFGVNNYRPDEKISGTFILGVVVFALSLLLCTLFLELIIKPSTPTLRKYSLWVLIEYVFIASFLFFVYNLLGDFHDFSFSSYLQHLVQFGTVLLFPFLGTHFYFRHRQVQ